MGSHFQIIAVITFLCILLMVVDDVSSTYPKESERNDDDNGLFIELRTRHLTIPVPYRPQEDYSHGGEPVNNLPEQPFLEQPEIDPQTESNATTNATDTTTDNATTNVAYHSSERTTGPEIHVQQGRGFGRSIKKKNKDKNSSIIINHSDSSNKREATNDDENNDIDEDTDDDGNDIQYDQEARLLAQMNVAGKYVPEPEDTEAQWGDACNPLGALEWDYCERAKYPNKGRMVCATKDLSLDARIVEGTCVCKFAKHNATVWKQLKYHEPSKLCRSPEGGVCYVKFRTDKVTASGDPIYVKHVEQAHEQCEDDQPIKSKKRKLLCSKPHPRRFSSYNAYHYYCLQKVDRLSWAGRVKAHFILIITMFVICKLLH